MRHDCYRHDCPPISSTNRNSIQHHRWPDPVAGQRHALETICRAVVKRDERHAWDYNVSSVVISQFSIIHTGRALSGAENGFAWKRYLHWMYLLRLRSLTVFKRIFIRKIFLAMHWVSNLPVSYSCVFIILKQFFRQLRVWTNEHTLFENTQQNKGKRKNATSVYNILYIKV